ncbi:MAG: hypothetical protein JST40_07755 [Armatimonadetes bacterium]|nr:hypothetical protein [Armatimonadota bacterium]
MITLTLAGLMLAQEQPAGEPKISAGQAISKMIALYHEKKSMAGTIILRQTFGNVAVEVETRFQYERPSKLYIRQVKRASDPDQALVTSDGVRFTYDAPKATAAEGRRLTETVKQGIDVLDYQRIYAAASACLIDRSAPLDLAISRLEDLKYLRNQWASIDNMVERESGYIINGKWRAYGNASVSGSYQIGLSKDFELTQYQIVEPMTFPNQPTQNMVSEWKVNIKPDAAVDASLFRVVP